MMKAQRMISVGYGNIIAVERIIAMVAPDASPIKRLVNEAKERGVLIDATCGRRTRAVVVMDTNHVLLSALNPETIANRINDNNLKEKENSDE